VELPAAEAVVERWRERGDPVSPRGVPAHVTVLYPFVTPPLDDHVLAGVAEVVVRHPTFTATFRHTERFGDRVLYLVPEPVEPFLALTCSLVARFPDHPPYAGEVAIDDLRPHCTVCHSDDQELLRDAATALAGMIPVVQVVDHVTVLAEDERQEWQVVARLPLGPAQPAG
jgi:hypothetical protein